MTLSIYESPFLLATVGLVLACILFLQWKRRDQLLFLSLAMFAAALVPAAFYLDATVETDREQVTIALEQIVTDYRDGNRAGVVDAISKRNMPLQLAAATLIDRFTFTDERLTDIAVTSAEDGYDAHFRLNADFVVNNHGSVGRRPTRWSVRWIREDDRWKVRDVTRLDPMNGKEIDGWESFGKR